MKCLVAECPEAAVAAACTTSMSTWTDMNNTWIMSMQHGELMWQGYASKDLV